MLTALWKKAESVSEDEPAPDISSLGRALRIRGILDTLGEIHIFGHVIGRINAGKMVLGVGGTVEGDVVAKEVLLCGRFEGRISVFFIIPSRSPKRRRSKAGCRGGRSISSRRSENYPRRYDYVFT